MISAINFSNQSLDPRTVEMATTVKGGYDIEDINFTNSNGDKISGFGVQSETPVSEAEVEDAYDKFSQYSYDEKKQLTDKYLEGMEKYYESNSCLRFKYASVEEFLKDNPEYQEAFDTVGVLVDDYKDKLKETMKEYDSSLSFFDKILNIFSGNSSSVEKTFQEKYIEEYPEAFMILGAYDELGKIASRIACYD